MAPLPAKVALVATCLTLGGTQRVTALLANHWVAAGRAVTLITLESAVCDRFPLDERVERVGLDVSALSANALRAAANNARRLFALRRAIRRSRATAVLSMGDDISVLALLATAGTGLRCVVAEQTDPRQHHIGRVWEHLRRLTYPMADAVVVQTDAVVPWARSVAKNAPVHVIRNPLRDMSRFAKENAPHDPVIVAASRLAPEKALDVLILAFRQVADEFPAWKLEILGEGPERAALASLTVRLGLSERVRFAGWVSEPGDVFARSSIFVMPSRYEGFPNALLEAMGSGLAVISTACTGPLEIITPERDGLLVPIGSTEALASALKRLMSNPELRTSLGSQALAVRERYRIQAIAQNWEALLDANGCDSVSMAVARAGKQGAP